MYKGNNCVSSKVDYIILGCDLVSVVGLSEQNVGTTSKLNLT